MTFIIHELYFGLFQTFEVYIYIYIYIYIYTYIYNAEINDKEYYFFRNYGVIS